MATPHDFIPLNPRDYLVLFALTGGERHGYGIVKEVEHQSDGTVRMDPSNLYRVLKRFTQQNVVEESEPKVQDDGDERRRYYTLTDFGRQVVKLEAARLESLTRTAALRNLLSDSERPA